MVAFYWLMMEPRSLSKSPMAPSVAQSGMCISRADQWWRRLCEPGFLSVSAEGGVQAVGGGHPGVY